jgi:hypothetical protein
MAIWEKATITDPDAPGDAGHRVNVDAGGTSWVRILSPSFRRDDGTEHTFIGYGNKLIPSELTMAATAAGYIARGMNPVQADKLAALVEGTAAGKTDELVGLGFPVPLANELIRQMVAGTGNESNLMGLGVPPMLAALIAADIEATDAE